MKSLSFIGGIIAPEQGLFPKYDAGVFSENNTTIIKIISTNFFI